MDIREKYDIIVVGAGVAGLNAARFLPRDKKILLLSKESPRHSDSYLAQGGICVLKWDGDYETYFEDTMRAGHYENDPETVGCMLRYSRENDCRSPRRGGAFYARRRPAIFSIPARAGIARSAFSITRTARARRSLPACFLTFAV